MSFIWIAPLVSSFFVDFGEKKRDFGGFDVNLLDVCQ